MVNHHPTLVYDAVVCVGPHKVQTAKLAIRSLQALAQPRRIYALVNARFFDELQALAAGGCQVILVDENTVLKAVTLADVERFLIQRTGSHRGAGWYFQQFLKMGACGITGIADYYLIWDSDTIMLRPVDFFDVDGRVLVNPKEENHKPYFELTQKLLGFGRCVPFSFISEHFMVNSAHMRELLQLIESGSAGAKNWVCGVLEQITTENLNNSGFSEFETYGNFLQVFHRDSYRCRALNSSRTGATLFGMSPSRCDLYYLMKRGYSVVSFERWNRTEGWRLLTPKLKAATKYLVDYIASIVTGSNKPDLRIVASLCSEYRACQSWRTAIQ